MHLVHFSESSLKDIKHKEIKPFIYSHFQTYSVVIFGYCLTKFISNNKLPGSSIGTRINITTNSSVHDKVPQQLVQCMIKRLVKNLSFRAFIE